MINVTKSFLPDLKEYVNYLEVIWERCHLTNQGQLVLELERKVREYLGVKHFFYVNNGTIALQIAIKAASLCDDVITTPFSYVATTSSLVWEDCNPVFADISKGTLTPDAASVESVLTSKTTGILLTHVYGNPCPVEEIAELAYKHKLKVIYDAAHAFGVEYKGTSVLNYGDISTLSFHATKLFHTVEGGGIVTNDDELAHKISYMRNFGHKGTEEFQGLGINGMASEFHAAMGLCIFPHIEDIMSKRKRICEAYTSALAKLPVSFLEIQEGTTKYNYAYFPVILQSETILKKVMAALEQKQVFPRRYFFPALNSLNYVTNNLVNDYATDVSNRIICLPLYAELKSDDVRLITDTIKSVLC